MADRGFMRTPWVPFAPDGAARKAGAEGSSMPGHFSTALERSSIPMTPTQNNYSNI